MKNPIINLCIGILIVFSSCENNILSDTGDSNKKHISQVKWDSVILQEHSVVWDFIGSIETELYVASLGSIYKTDNKGATWKELINYQYSIYGLRTNGDTIFGITMYPRSTIYSLDQGDSWHEYSKHLFIKSESDTLTVKNASYRIENKWTDEPYSVIESAILYESKDNGIHWTEIFYTKGYIARLYTDSMYVYVSTNPNSWDKIAFYYKKIDV